MVHTRSSAPREFPSRIASLIESRDDNVTFALITDRQLRILVACPATARLSGYARDDLAGQHFGHLVEETHRRLLLRAGAFALLGVRQEMAIRIGTSAGLSLSMRAQVHAVTWKGDRRCLLWTLQPTGRADTAAEA